MNTNHPHHRRKGSVLLVTLILGLALAIAVGSFVSLSLTALKDSTRSFHYNTAFNLAESGLEEAMWALNNNDWTKRNWQENGQSWVLTGTLTASELTAANSVRGYFNVVVQQASGGAPIITAEGVVEQKYGGLIRKQLRVLARNSNLFMPPSPPSPTSRSMVAKSTATAWPTATTPSPRGVLRPPWPAPQSPLATSPSAAQPTSTAT